MAVGCSEPALRPLEVTGYIQSGSNWPPPHAPAGLGLSHVCSTGPRALWASFTLPLKGQVVPGFSRVLCSPSCSVSLCVLSAF